MSAAQQEIERHYDKVVKILARVSGGSSEGERRAAAYLAAKYLTDHPMPLRWFVPKGTICRVVPAMFTKPENLRQAQHVIRHVALHKAEMFPESLRVKVADDAVLEQGCLYFERHGYAVFVPVEHVQVML